MITRGYTIGMRGSAGVCVCVCVYGVYVCMRLCVNGFCLYGVYGVYGMYGVFVPCVYGVCVCVYSRSGQRLRGGSSCFDSQVTVRSQSGHSQVNGQVTVRSCVLWAFCDFFNKDIIYSILLIGSNGSPFQKMRKKP